MDEKRLSGSARWIRHMDKGRLYLNRGEFKKAIVELNEAIAMDDEDMAPSRIGMAYYLRGTCYDNLNDLDAAARDFEKAWLIDQRLLYYETMERIKQKMISQKAL
ncbi:MAG: hypothetical protein ACUVV0_10815 [Anaerolineae bacterium]